MLNNSTGKVRPYRTNQYIVSSNKTKTIQACILFMLFGVIFSIAFICIFLMFVDTSLPQY